MVDRFPNYMRAAVTQGSADAFATVSIPVPRQTRSGSFIVKELLYIDFHTDTLLNAAGEIIFFQLSQGATPTAVFAASSSRAIATVQLEMQLLTSGAFLFKSPVRVNLQTCDGFGFLFAGEELHFNLDSTGTTLSNLGEIVVAYRDVLVSETELNGLVISLLS